MFIVGLLVGLILATSATSFAASETVQASFERFVLVINGGEPQEIEPLTYKGTTYLPVRETANRLGYDVTYKADMRTIELSKPTEKEKRVDDVSTIIETNQPQTIELDPDIWVSEWELKNSYDFQFSIGLPQGHDPSSDDRELKLIYQNKTESWIIPKIITEDFIVHNENGNEIAFKNGMKYFKKSFAEQFFQ